MEGDLINVQYNSSWGEVKIGKLWVETKDLLENGKRPLLPSKSFYENWTGTIDDLHLMTNKILKYLDFQSPIRIDIEFDSQMKSPGVFRIKNSIGKIKVNSKHKENSRVCAAVLAHEICHLILAIRHTEEENVYENERLTDFVTVYFGLGVLVLNGKHIRSETSFKSLLISVFGILSLVLGGAGFWRDPTQKVKYSFGYWSPEEYRKIFDEYIVRNNLPIYKIEPYICKGN